MNQQTKATPTTKVYSMDDMSSDEVKMSPTRKKNPTPEILFLSVFQQGRIRRRRPYNILRMT